MSQEGIDKENHMGNTCCRRIMDSLNSLATQNLQQLNSFLLEAIKKQWLLVLIIDDYTTEDQKEFIPELPLARVELL